MTKITSKEIKELWDFADAEQPECEVKLKSAISRLEELEARNEVLESAVAWHGFDELPSVDEIIADRKNGVEKRIELKDSDGRIIYNISVTLHNADFYVACGYVGWRYAVGDLS